MGRLQVPMPTPADLVDAVRNQLSSAVVDWPTLHVIVEPGRSVVGNAGVFVTKVLGWKSNGNKKYCILRLKKPLITLLLALTLSDIHLISQITSLLKKYEFVRW